jgi:hypothetical protein
MENLVHRHMEACKGIGGGMRAFVKKRDALLKRQGGRDRFLPGRADTHMFAVVSVCMFE